MNILLNGFLSILLAALAVLPNSSLKSTIESRIKARILPAQTNSAETSFDWPVLGKVPEKSQAFKEISTGSSAAYFEDVDSGEVLFSRDPGKRVPIASITKLMTALVVVEKLDPNKVVTVAPFEVKPLDSVMGLSVGDKIKVQELLNGLLVESGADAAEVLAAETAGSEKQFVALMNERAAILGLKNTQFSTPVGDDDSDQGYSTAKDVAKLSRIALKNKQIAEIVARKSYVATIENGKQFSLTNTNKLLNGNYQGIKTGTTYAAGECLASYYNDGGRQIIGVVLGSADRFGETSALIDWAKNNFRF